MGQLAHAEGLNPGQPHHPQNLVALLHAGRREVLAGQSCEAGRALGGWELALVVAAVGVKDEDSSVVHVGSLLLARSRGTGACLRDCVSCG